MQNEFNINLKNPQRSGLIEERRKGLIAIAQMSDPTPTCQVFKHLVGFVSHCH